MRAPLIVLLTDFGNRDGYAGVMKGVILGICPGARILDLTHDIPPQDIQAANFVLYAHYRYYPPGTIFVVVVDPTVGTNRRPILVETEQYFFISPDNGSLSYVLHQEKIKKAVQVQNKKFFLQDPSHSFHGLDVFSPVGAYLALGRKRSEFGPAILPKSIVSWPFPKVKTGKGGLCGTVLYVDHFGSLITNMTREDIKKLIQRSSQAYHVMVRDHDLGDVCRTYADRKPGDLLAFISSGGFLEIAQNMGSAARALQAGVGEEVWIKRRDS